MLKLKKISIALLLGILLTSLCSMTIVTFADDDKKHNNKYNNKSKIRNGLQAEYYNTVDFKGLKFTRIDSRISFDWGNDSPNKKLNNEKFSVRWTGQVEPLYTEEYTFHTITDDGVRLWINNQLIIDQWDNHAATEYKGTVQLVARQKYNIKMEYYQNKNDACAKLL